MSRNRGGRRGRRTSVAVQKSQPSVEVLEKGEPAYALSTTDILDWSNWKAEATKGDVYKDSVWALACIRSIAQTAASVRLALYRKTPPGKPDEEIHEHPLIDLVTHPNPDQSGYDMIEEVMWQFMLWGHNYLELVGRYPSDVENPRFIPMGLFPLKAQFVEPIPDSKYRVAGYVYTPGTNRILFNRWEVIQTRLYNPESDIEGYSPYTTARPAVDVDKETQDYSRRFFERGAMPGTILESDRLLPKQLAERTKKIWNTEFRGTKKAHGVAILSGGLKYKPVSMSFRDMDFERIRKLAREEILAAGDVPPIKVGIMDGASWSNAYQQKLDFLSDTVGPLILKFILKLNSELVIRFSRDLYFKPDFSTYLRSPEQEEGNERRARALWNDQLITRDEARKLIGRDPAGEGGDDYKETSSGGSSIRARTGNSVVSDGEERSRAGLPYSPDRSRTTETRPRTNRVRDNGNTKIDQQSIRDSLIKVKDEYRLRLRRCMADMFASQYASSVEKFASNSAEHKAFLYKADEVQIADYLGSVSVEFQSSFASLLVPTIQKSIEIITSSILGCDSVDTSDIFTFVQEQVVSIVKTANITTSRSIKEALDKAVSPDTSGIQDVLKDVFLTSNVAERRVVTTVETQLTKAIGYAVQQVLKISGWMAKTWVCSAETSRSSHFHAEGQTVRVDELFYVGGEFLMYPGDSIGSPANVCGCQCYIVPGVQDDIVTKAPERAIQSLLFDRDQFKRKEAVKWAVGNNCSSGVESTERYWRLKQKDPSVFEPNGVDGETTFKIMDVAEGVRAIIGKLRDSNGQDITLLNKPYRGASDSSLPEDIKNLSEKKRAQFVSVFNRVLSDTGDEGRAFATARAAVKGVRKEEIPTDGS